MRIDDTPGLAHGGHGASAWFGPEVRLERFDLSVYVHQAVRDNVA